MSPCPSPSPNKIYLSTQLRLLTIFDETITIGNAVLDAAATQEGLEQATVQKVTAATARVSGRLERDDAFCTLTAKNVRTTESGDAEDLHIRGCDTLKAATTVSLRLALLGEVVKGLTCQDECALEYSPAFLHRSILDAQSGGVVLPSWALEQVVHRQALSLLRDGNVGAAVATADMALQASCKGFLDGVL